VTQLLTALAGRDYGRRVSIGTLDERAAAVLAATVKMWRDHGASDEELVAAGGRAVAEAIAAHNRGDDGPLPFELRVSQTVTEAITNVLAKPEPLGALCRGNFDKEVQTRLPKIRRDPGRVREVYTAELGASADGLSAYALAVFDLYNDRFGPIRVKLGDLLERDERARRVLPPDEDPDFDVQALELPADGERKWIIVLAFEDRNSIAHVHLDGWTVEGISWTH
jgi:hypothetical protein